MSDHRAPTAEAADWFARFDRACAEIVEATGGLSPQERSTIVGHGAGGDRTVAIDQIAEDIVVAELERAAADGDGLSLVSEEVGQVALGGGGNPILVVDPIDGSLNAKRAMPYYATSIAVADGPLMGDVFLGYVYDYATGNVFTAERGVGAWLNGEPMAKLPRDGRLRLVAVEGAYPHRMAVAADALRDALRLRMIGALALSLCTVAAGWADGMAGLGGARSVDVAAGQLIARECGAAVSTPDSGTLNEFPLDVTTHRCMIAAANPDSCASLAAAARAARDADR